MRRDEQGTLLRIFFGESDRLNHRPLYEIIVEEARARGLAGATVLRGVEGFGAASVIHTARLLRLSEDLPMIVEIVDADERIESFIPIIDDLIDRARCGAFITTEHIRVIRHTPGSPIT